MSSIEHVRFVAHVAMRHYEELTTTDRIRLLEGLSQILPKEEADEAGQAAWLIRKAEARQMKLLQLIDKPTERSPLERRNHE